MTKTTHRLYIGSFFFVGFAVTILLAFNGYEYYSTPLKERFFNSQNNILKPSGLVGHGLGIIGTLMMIVGVGIYMIRKRYRKIFSWGYLKYWLELHIFLCSLGPVLVLYHTAFKFGGIVSVSFWSMVAVVLSGVIGRFIYVQIPRTIQGKEIDSINLSKMSESLSNDIKNDYNVSENILSKIDKSLSLNNYESIKPFSGVIFIIKNYFRNKIIWHVTKRDLKKAGLPNWKIKKFVKTYKSKLILSRRIGMLRTTQKLFRYWHIFHLPFAIVMFAIMLIHVGVTIAFGYKWIF